MRSLRLQRISILLAGTLGATSALAADDLILRQRITVASSTDPPREQMQYYSPSVRISDDERARSIIDLDRKTLTIIDKRRQTYSVLTFAELENRQDTHDARVKALPPGVRNMINADEKVVLKPTGKTETIAGYATAEYSIEGKGIGGNVWIAASLDLGGRSKEWDRLTDLFGGKSSPGGHLDEALSKIKGITLRRIVIMQPLPMATTEVVEVRRGSAPAELRRIPEGFKKVDPPAPRKAQ